MHKQHGDRKCAMQACRGHGHQSRLHRHLQSACCITRIVQQPCRARAVLRAGSVSAQRCPAEAAAYEFQSEAQLPI